MFSEEGYEKTYEWALRLIKQYPNCNMLIWQTAVMLDARRITVSYTHLVETVVLLSQLKQKPDDYINVTIELDDMDITSAETKASHR